MQLTTLHITVLILNPTEVIPHFNMLHFDEWFKNVNYESRSVVLPVVLLQNNLINERVWEEVCV